MEGFSEEEMKRAMEAFVADIPDLEESDGEDWEEPVFEDGAWSADGRGDDEEDEAADVAEEAGMPCGSSAMREEARKFARLMEARDIRYHAVKKDEIFHMAFFEPNMLKQHAGDPFVQVAVVFDRERGYAQFFGFPGLHVPVQKLLEALEAANAVNAKYSDITCTVDDDLDFLFTSTQRYLAGNESFAEGCFLCMTCMEAIVDEAYPLLALAARE